MIPIQIPRRSVLLGAAAGLALPHVRTAFAQDRLDAGPEAAAAGLFDVSDNALGFRVDSIREHSVNCYWIKGPDGVFGIDALWRIPEANLALDQFQRGTGAGIEALKTIAITHPHTDHYGGLKTFLDASGGRAIASATTERVIRNDEHGFYANRLEDIPGEIPDDIPVPGRGIRDGAGLDAAGRAVVAALRPGNEAIETTLLYLGDDKVLFSADLVNNETIPVLFQGDLDGWLAQLRALRADFPEAQVIAPGHGAPGPFDELVEAEIAWLTTFSGLIAKELDRGGGAITQEAATRIKRDIVDAFPTWRTTAGVPTRDRLLDLNIGWVLEGWRISSGRAEDVRAFRPEGQE